MYDLWIQQNYGAELRTDEVTFNNISCDYIIEDEYGIADIFIYNTEISITSGSIYYSNHVLQGNIYIYNMSIQTNQLDGNNDALLQFASLDITVINNLSIMYMYDAQNSCEYARTETNSLIGASAIVYECSNPMTGIRNEGEVRYDIFSD